MIRSLLKFHAKYGPIQKHTLIDERNEFPVLILKGPHRCLNWLDLNYSTILGV